MTNITNSISSTSSPYSGTGINSQSTSSSTADIISSFKEILAVMTAMNGISSSGQPASMGMSMGDLMAPLMLLMIERLLEQELNQDAPAGAEQSSAKPAAQSGTLQNLSSVSSQYSSSGVFGAKPEPSGWPVNGRITQEPRPGHIAFDIAVPVGTPIKTTMDGKVIHAGWNNQGYGNLVIIENGAYRTYYAHLSSIPVSVGDQVTAGATIGLSGNTGNSTGPHLHYEIRKDRTLINPTAMTKGMS